MFQETSSDHAVPKGKTRAVMLVRFPDTFLASFRDCIQREQNNLLDSEEAFLAALSPQVTSLFPFCFNRNLCIKQEIKKQYKVNENITQPCVLYRRSTHCELNY